MASLLELETKKETDLIALLNFALVENSFMVTADQTLGDKYVKVHKKYVAYLGKESEMVILPPFRNRANLRFCLKRALCSGHYCDQSECPKESDPSK